MKRNRLSSLLAVALLSLPWLLVADTVQRIYTEPNPQDPAESKEPARRTSPTPSP